MLLEKVKLIEFPRFDDSRGSLSYAQSPDYLPFEIKRVYYLYNNKSDSTRGQHAHKKLEQVIIPICGSFQFTLDDGKNKKTYLLNEPHIGLYVPQMMWRELYDFSPDSVCLVLASDQYHEEDYYRDYQEFLDAVK